ncbi:calcium-binding protein [Actinoplanes aureus]|uniref:Calcium-binding protein n=1 Tax=Actinoplanes aureus TaxID=2792083 RepID=A0A931FV17_9ACTN|nr:calcium-binding protein [Actinoplanes aureus]MBG0560848.1 calcium-binding protein [Actinoplanes aureus]
MVRSVWLPRVALTLFTTVSAAALAAPAQAAAVAGFASVSGTTVQYKAAKGKQNKVVVTRSGNTVTIDDRVAVKPGKGCKAVKRDKTKVRCTTSKAPGRVRVYTYDRADSIRNSTSLPIYADGGTAADTIVGGPASDRLDGQSGADKIYGGGGNDVIEGWTGANQIWGGSGEDHIRVWTGANVIYGGAAKDTVWGSNSADRIYGEAGRDELFGQGGNDVIDGGADRDYILGEDGVDVLYGGAGNDYLRGDYGNDTLHGGDGVDELHAENGNDRVYGGAGDDQIYANAIQNDGDKEGQGADYYSGGAGIDRVSYGSYLTSAVTADADGLNGDDGADGEGDTIATDVETIWGGSGDDKLYGRDAPDTLVGGAGDDRLQGNGGYDVLYGDGGDDYLDGGNDGVLDALDGGDNYDSCHHWDMDELGDCERYITP